MRTNLPALLAAIMLVLTPRDWPRWALMWLVAVALFAGCKWLTWRDAAGRGASVPRQLGYLLAWPGMDGDAFLSSDLPRENAPSFTECLFALVKLATGVTILWGVLPQLDGFPPYLTGWIGMVGLVLLLHFGLFHLLSCAWRSAGVNAAPLMHWPIASTSLSQFWGQRWNRAFRDHTHRYLFRPLVPRCGPRAALVIGFLVSGLIHESVTSLPAGGGYGRPTAFFTLQAVGILLERSPIGRRLGLGRGWRGWLFAAALLLAPAVLLFHPPFVLRVIVPFLQAIGCVACQSY